MRIIMAFLVVCLHVEWPVQKVGLFFTDFARIAVPYFIMLSGYFYKRGKTMEYIKKFFVYYIYASILYLIVLFLLYRNWNFLDVELTKFCSYKFWICNSTPFVPVGWYLFAMIYIYILIYIVSNSKVLLYTLSILSFFLALFLGNYSFLLFDNINSLLWSCSFICTFFWFVLGMYIKKHNVEIIVFCRSKIGSSKILCLFCIFLLFSIMEHYAIKYIIGYSCKGTIYISTIFACLFLFLYLLCEPNKLKIQTGKLPLWIFLTHIAFHYCLVIIFFTSKYSLGYSPFIDIDINKSLLVNNITVFMISIIMYYCLTGISKIFKKI